METLLEDPYAYPDFEFLAYWQVVFNNACAILVFMAWLKVRDLLHHTDYLRLQCHPCFTAYIEENMVLGYIDLEKAFDTVPRDMAMATLRWMGVPEVEVRMVEGTYVTHLHKTSCMLQVIVFRYTPICMEGFRFWCCNFRFKDMFTHICETLIFKRFI